MQNRKPASRSRRMLLAHAKRIHQRLNGDLHLAVLMLFVILGILVLTPFAVYRILEGNFLSAFGSIATILIWLFAGTYAWTTGQTAAAARVIVIFLVISQVFMINVAGHMPYWVFPAVVVNFMLAKWRLALPANAIMVVTVALGAPVLEQTIDVFTFVAPVLLVGLFSMIFVLMTDIHHDRLSALVARDALTGALNRRMLRDDLSDAILQAQRLERPAALALLDLDNFKRINDTQGHSAGDQVLIDLARLVHHQIRSGDLFYRLGGEEFVLLLNHTDQQGAETAINKLMEVLRAGLRGPAGPVTVSIGVAAYQPDETWSEWLARADQAMYHAKRAGKNRIVFAEGGGTQG